MQNSQPVIVENLTKKYGNFTALDNVNFTVNRGEVFGYLGPNGAGKTTTIRLITGLSRPSHGVCKLFGKIPNTAKDLYNRIGVLFEEKNLYQRLTGLQNLKFFASLYNIDNIRINKLLTRFGLKGAENKRVVTYSKGMKQRLLICRTLLHKPELLILDEPTDGLDPNSAGVIINAIKEFVKSGKTVFLSSHNMNEVDELCNRVAFLKNGELITINNPDKLKKIYGQSLLQLNVRGKDINKLQEIINDEDSITESGKNIYSLNLYMDGKNYLKKLEKLSRMKEFEILNIHSREASLKEVFKKLTL